MRTPVEKRVGKCAVRVPLLPIARHAPRDEWRKEERRISDRSWWKIGVILSLEKHCPQRRIQMIYNKSQGHNRSYGVPFLKGTTHPPSTISASFNVRSGDFESCCTRSDHVWWRIRQRYTSSTVSSLIMMTAIRFKEYYRTTVLFSRQLVYVPKGKGNSGQRPNALVQ